MASRTITQLISDLSGDEIDGDKGETIEFSFRGVGYTIDLTEKEASGFDKSIAMYLEHATRTGGRRGRRGSSTSTSDYSAKEVRVWATENGIDVPSRGRIPTEVLEQYRATN